MAHADADRQRQLLLDIARCPVLLQQFAEPKLDRDCSALINCQAPLNRRTYQVPEPWSGDLQTSRILFFGSNPSINTVEQFPTLAWSDAEIEDFFLHRFEGGRSAWVDPNLRVLRVDGTHGKRESWVRYWAACRARATEMLGRPARPGVDFAISEVVHCKSRRESQNGKAVTRLATRACSPTYTRRIIGISGAKVICVMGHVPGDELRSLFKIGNEVRFAGPLVVEGLERFIVFLDHPAGPGRIKKVVDALTADQQALVVAAIR